MLTPETRPLTMLEARSAAQQAFLKALKEPGLGDNLSRITVVVRLMPASHPDPGVTEQVIVFLHKGGQDWACCAASRLRGGAALLRCATLPSSLESPK